MSGTTATLTVELDVSSGSARAASPTYTDVSTKVGDSLTTKRGRTYELADMNDGESTFSFDNDDRTFDPTNTAGAYYPNLKPMRPIRLTVTLSAVNYRIFTGYVLEFPPVWEGPGWSYVTVRAVDGMVPLALSNAVGSWSQEKTGTRIGHVLDAIGFPAANRVVDTGGSTIEAKTFIASDQKQALDHIRDCEHTETGGLFFFDGQGRAVFKSRSTQLVAQGTSSVTFGDTGADLLYETAPGDYSDRLIYNSVTVTDDGSNSFTVTDSASEDAYWGPRSLARATMLPSGSTEKIDAANLLLGIYAQPGFRFKSLTFMASLNDTAMLEAVTREIGDRITVKKTPPGGGAQIVQDCIVQSIAHTVTPGDDLVWFTTYELAPASTATYWIAGVTGVADQTTIPAYV